MNCRICDSTDLKLYYTQGDKDQFKLYKCGSCGLVNLNIEGIDIYGAQEKYEFEQKLPDIHDPKINHGNKATYAFIKKNIKQKGSFLDIGSGSGALLYYAREDGWQVKGLELSEYLAMEVTKRYGIEVQPKNFMDLETFEEQFDLVSLRHVLEHIPDSILAMEKISKLVKPGGQALLEFPNIEGVSFKFKRFLNKFGLAKKKYNNDYLPGHCNEFSKKSFTYLAQKMGFEIVLWETYSRGKFANLLYTVMPIGTKARVLIRKG